MLSEPSVTWMVWRMVELLKTEVDEFYLH
jgi:hypothetical protein